MKSLFTDDNAESYNEDAIALSKEAGIAIGKIVRKYAEMGFSVRDIEYILESEVTAECLSILVFGGIDKLDAVLQGQAKNEN